MNNGMNPPVRYNPKQCAYKLGLVVRALRRQRGMTQGEYAYACKIKIDLISRIETGKRTKITVDELASLCNGFDISADEMLKYCERENFIWKDPD